MGPAGAVSNNRAMGIYTATTEHGDRQRGRFAPLLVWQQVEIIRASRDAAAGSSA